MGSLLFKKDKFSIPEVHVDKKFYLPQFRRSNYKFQSSHLFLNRATIPITVMNQIKWSVSPIGSSFKESIIKSQVESI